MCEKCDQLRAKFGKDLPLSFALLATMMLAENQSKQGNSKASSNSGSTEAIQSEKFNFQSIEEAVNAGYKISNLVINKSNFQDSLNTAVERLRSIVDELEAVDLSKKPSTVHPIDAIRSVLHKLFGELLLSLDVTDPSTLAGVSNYLQEQLEIAAKNAAQNTVDNLYTDLGLKAKEV